MSGQLPVQVHKFQTRPRAIIMQIENVFLFFVFFYFNLFFSNLFSVLMPTATRLTARNSALEPSLHGNIGLARLSRGAGRIGGVFFFCGGEGSLRTIAPGVIF